MSFLDPNLQTPRAGGTGLLEPPAHREGGGAELDQGASGPPPIDWDQFGGWGGGSGGDGEGPGGEGGEGDGPSRPEGAAELGLGLGLISIAGLFAIFFAAHLWLRKSSEVWPPRGFENVPVGLWTSSVLLVLCSVVLEVGARMSSQYKNFGRDPARARAGRKLVSRLLLSAWCLGALFLAAQAYVWQLLVGTGRLPQDKSFLSVFYTLTGLHALHVVGGLAYLAAQVWVWRGQRELEPGGVRRCAIYWHFMGVVWVVLFVLLYLPKGGSA